ncbi:hypothetical protein [Thauera sp.]|uniref:hypothetical protein n=1 Tax=Thauera sp. TaxID=1905334 RepID=UPI0039E4EE1C
MTVLGPSAWLDQYCPSLDGQFLFLDPLWWDTHQLNEGATLVLREAAEAIEKGSFDDFQQDVESAGGWPPGLEKLARTLMILADSASVKG